MVTFYPDVSCWAWVMAHAALIGPMWLNACAKFRVIPAAGRRLVPGAMPFITSDILQIDGIGCGSLPSA
jgi:hypothetical protein